MNKRRSITAAFSSHSAAEELPEVQVDVAPRSTPRIAAGIIGATGRTLTGIREERDSLRAQLAAGQQRELDPAQIDPSPFPDRLAEANDAAFALLRASIEADGQKVPIQVRAHPKEEGRYQIVFGHRRWRASKELVRKVRVEVVTASDQELAVAQGIENSARQDLSWIERALFAAKLEEAGIQAKSIRAALSVDDPELARFRAVCRAIPRDLIEQIGRAPKVGRPRWADLAKRVKGSAEINAIRRSLAADKVATSDERFRAALSALIETKQATAPAVYEIKVGERVFGSVTSAEGTVKLAVEFIEADALAAFMARELPSLIKRFHAEHDIK